MTTQAPPEYPTRSLESWDAEQLQAWADKLRQGQHPEEFSNGLACPQCGVSHLYDTGKQYSIGPTVLQVKCMSPTCDFKGTRRGRVWRDQD